MAVSVESVIKALQAAGVPKAIIEAMDRQALSVAIRMVTKGNDAELNGDVINAISKAYAVAQKQGTLGIGSSGGLGANVDVAGKDSGGESTGDGGFGNIPETGGKGGDGMTAKEKARAKRARKQDNFNDETSFLSTLQGLGIKVTPNLQQLVAEAVKKNWNLTTFEFYVQKTPEFKQTFPGIFNKDGTLKMTPAEYVAFKASAGEIASQYGINFNDKKLADLVRGDTSLGEWKTRAEAISRLRRDPGLMHQFEAVTGRQITKKEAYDIVTGAADKKFYDQWQETLTRNAASDAGIKLKAGSDAYDALRANLVKKISKQGFTEDAMREGFEQIASSLLEDLPEARLQGYGLSKKEIVNSVFGGKGSARTKKLIERIQATKTRFEDENEAAAQTFATEGGGLGVLGMASQRRAQTD